MYLLTSVLVSGMSVAFKMGNTTRVTISVVLSKPRWSTVSLAPPLAATIFVDNALQVIRM